MGILVF